MVNILPSVENFILSYRFSSENSQFFFIFHYYFPHFQTVCIAVTIQDLIGRIALALNSYILS